MTKAKSTTTGDVIRLAAVADFHCTKTSRGSFRGLFEQVAEEADILASAAT